jgi:peptidoglycan/xylan/chitin deacetylase (PgdA/CDA1 family)
MIRRALKQAACAALAWSGAAHLLGRVTRATPSRSPLVLGYHRVVDDMRDAVGIGGMCVTAKTLARHVDWVARRYRVVSLDELALRLRAGADCSRLAAFTFDDGYRDVFDHGLPVLSAKGIPAAVFVAVDHVGSDELLLHDRLFLALERRLGRDRAEMAAYPATRALLAGLSRAELAALTERIDDGVVPRIAKRLAPATWPMLSAALRAGFTIGSHTRTHALLPGEPAARRADETAGAKRRLESALSVPIRYFAYPDGAFSPAAVRAVRAAGYELAFTICGHQDPRRPLFTVPRRLFWEGSTRGAAGGFSSATLACHAAGALDLGAPCRRPHA